MSIKNVKKTYIRAINDSIPQLKQSVVYVVYYTDNDMKQKITSVKELTSSTSNEQPCHMPLKDMSEVIGYSSKMGKLTFFDSSKEAFDDPNNKMQAAYDTFMVAKQESDKRLSEAKKKAGHTTPSATTSSQPVKKTIKQAKIPSIKQTKAIETPKLKRPSKSAGVRETDIISPFKTHFKLTEQEYVDYMYLAAEWRSELSSDMTFQKFMDAGTKTNHITQDYRDVVASYLLEDLKTRGVKDLDKIPPLSTLKKIFAGDQNYTYLVDHYQVMFQRAGLSGQKAGIVNIGKAKFNTANMTFGAKMTIGAAKLLFKGSAKAGSAIKGAKNAISSAIKNRKNKPVSAEIADTVASVAKENDTLAKTADVQPTTQEHVIPEEKHSDSISSAIPMDDLYFKKLKTVFQSDRIIASLEKIHSVLKPKSDVDTADLIKASPDNALTMANIQTDAKAGESNHTSTTLAKAETSPDRPSPLTDFMSNVLGEVIGERLGRGKKGSKAPSNVPKTSIPSETPNIPDKGTETKPTGKPEIRKKGTLAKGGAKALEFAKVASKLVGKLALPLAALMTVADAGSGFMSAKENLGIEDREATFGEKLSSAGGGVISGLSFGMLDEKNTSKNIANFFGAGETKLTPKSSEDKKQYEIYSKSNPTGIPMPVQKTTSSMTDEHVKKAESVADSKTELNTSKIVQAVNNTTNKNTTIASSASGGIQPTPRTSDSSLRGFFDNRIKFA